jgi:hypothetical protein
MQEWDAGGGGRVPAGVNPAVQLASPYFCAATEYNTCVLRVLRKSSSD